MAKESIIDSMEVQGYPNYTIYSDGRVYSKLRKKYLKGHDRGRGYLQYRLYDNNGIQKAFNVHRLVAKHFIANPENKPTVNHINGNKKDNRVENLRWATHSEQTIHAMQTGLLKPNTSGIGKPGKYHGMSKPVTNGKKIYESANLARKDGFHSSAISLCCNGKLKTHGGYKWSFVKVA